ncbi:MAG: ArsI/CadI family heavy metal resistance metalloenzyme [Gammaproteobacteria bacterium]
MKRFHVNLSVADLQQSVTFYQQLFAQEPTVLKSDYAKWMLDDPRINFSVTTRGTEKGIDHLGLQSDDGAEFEALRERLQQADMSSFEQADVTCCYARSSKSWVRDPDNVAWETFVSYGESSVYDDEAESAGLRNVTGDAAGAVQADSCCASKR